VRRVQLMDARGLGACTFKKQVWGENRKKLLLHYAVFQLKKPKSKQNLQSPRKRKQEKNVARPDPSKGRYLGLKKKKQKKNTDRPNGGSKK